MPQLALALHDYRRVSETSFTLPKVFALTDYKIDIRIDLRSRLEACPFLAQRAGGRLAQPESA